MPRRLATGGHSDLPDTGCLEIAVLPDDMKATLSADQPGWMPEHSEMVGHSGRHVVPLQFLWSEHALAADDAAIDLVEHELTSELDGRARLVAPQDTRMRRKQADELLLCRHLAARYHARTGLVNDLGDQRQEAIQFRQQARWRGTTARLR